MAEQKEGAYLQIGEVAERTGVTQRTLRFYEEKGLLKPPSRMEGGFRLYSEDDIGRVEAIKRLQKLLGFSLAEIKEMIEAEEVRMEVRAQYQRETDVRERKRQLLRAQEAVQHQYDLVRQKLDQLSAMGKELEERLQRLQKRLEELEAAEVAEIRAT